jgi:hypothetical protein
MSDSTASTVHNILAPGFDALRVRGGVHVYKEDDPTVYSVVHPAEAYEASWYLMRDNIEPEELLDLVTLRVKRFDDIKAEYEALEEKFEYLRKCMGHDTYREISEDPEPDRAMSPSDWTDWAEKKSDARARAKNHERHLLSNIAMLAREDGRHTAEACHAYVLKGYGKSRADALYPPDLWEQIDGPDADGEDEAYMWYETRKTALRILEETIPPQHEDETSEQFGRRKHSFLIGKYGKKMADEVFYGRSAPGTTGPVDACEEHQYDGTFE